MSASPIRRRGSWKVHKLCSEPDRWLDEMGFFRKHTAGDPSCLFRAVSENIYHTQRFFHEVRLDCVNFMSNNRHLFEGSVNCSFEIYLNGMSNPSEWGGFVEILAMSHLYRRDFIVFEANKGPQTKICHGYGNTIYLFYTPDTKHFDVMYSKEYIQASSFCQSIVYEILYDGVYQLKDLAYAVEKMLHEKVGNHMEYFMSENVDRRKKQKERSKIFIEAVHNDDKEKNNNAIALKCRHHLKDIECGNLLRESLSIFVFNRSLIQLENVCLNCLNVNSAKDLFDNGITPFPYKVAKALDPDIYRNIEFDVWSELRRELRYGARYSDGTTLQIGVKCLCKLQPEQSVPYHCHIQEMQSNGPCLVFIEELGEKHVVNYDQLEPLPQNEIKPWAPPYRYSRANSTFMSLTQMLQQIGKLSKKQGCNAHKTRVKKNASEETKGAETATTPSKILSLYYSKDEVASATEAQYMTNDSITCSHLDLSNFVPPPVEIQALPLMVDCRPGGGAPHDLHAPAPHTAPPQHTAPPPHTAPPQHNNAHTHAAHNGGGPQDNHNQQPRIPVAGDAVPPLGIPPPAPVRVSTPATNTVTTFTGPMGGGGMGMNVMGVAPGMGMGVAPGMGVGVAPGGYGPGGYMCGVKPVLWCSHTNTPPPHNVNPHQHKSVQPNGSDLPMNDIPTLRYYFNLGVECMWATYGPPPHPPPRHYSPRDLAQDMQQISLQDRPVANTNDHKHKPNDKPPPAPNNKGNGQRPLLGPRFKRGNNQDGNQNNNHHQNKGQHNKPPNNNSRRNSFPDGRGAVYEGEPEGMVPMHPATYIPYPPPVYPLPYYQIEPDPGVYPHPYAMMGMMSSMGYMGYEEGLEYPPPMAMPYYAPPPYPPAAHHEHK